MTMTAAIAAERPSSLARATNTPGLTPEQVEFFEENGFLGPLTLCTPEEMAELREWVREKDFATRKSPIYGLGPFGRCLRDWHLVYRPLHWLAVHPVLAAAIGSIYGPDLLLWRTTFFVKPPGALPVAWHQDLGFPGHRLTPALNPIKNISAWISIDTADTENGCVWVVPKTHKQKLEARMSKTSENEAGLFGRRYKVEYKVDTSTAVPMICQPGQYFLFSESALHGSTRNPTNRRRDALSLRITTPDVKVYEGQTVDGQGFPLEKWGCLLLSGKDRFGYNKIIDPQFVE